MLKVLDHPNVLKVKRIYEDKNCFYIVMDNIRGTNLAQFLFTMQRDERLVKTLAIRFFQGLHYLHSLGLSHRDIKLENVMVVTAQEGFIPVIVDFGLCRLFLAEERSGDRVGSLLFSSPEMLL